MRAEEKFNRLLDAHVSAIHKSGRVDYHLDRALMDLEHAPGFFPEFAVFREHGPLVFSAYWQLHVSRVRLVHFLKRHPEFVQDALAKVNLSEASHHDALQQWLKVWPF